MMESLGKAYRALVIGSTGTLGQTFVEVLEDDPNCAQVHTLSRYSTPALHLEQPESFVECAHQMKAKGPFELIIDATGALTIDGHGPEKSLAALDAHHLTRAFEINATGPVLLLKNFHTLLAPGRSIYAKLSARVGSISDNRKGGWYGYRASKAALNMFLQTAAIEIQRRKPDTVIAALQPGTVHSSLSAPFISGHETTPAKTSVSGMLQTLDHLDTAAGAQFRDYRGNPIPW